MKLTAKQEAFCMAYAKSGNATQSFKDAGYKWKSEGAVRVLAHNLLNKNPNIKKRLAEIAAEMADSKIADAREIQERLTEIIRQTLDEEQIVVEGCGEGISEARVMKRKSQLKDIIKAAEVLAKMQGAFDNTVRLEMTVPKFAGEDNLSE